MSARSRQNARKSIATSAALRPLPYAQLTINQPASGTQTTPTLRDTSEYRRTQLTR